MKLIPMTPSTYEARIGKFVLCSPVCQNWHKLGQIFELLLLPEFTMDLTETFFDETMDIDHQTSAARIREFVVCSPAISKCEQFFESLLLNEFTMDLSETHSNATMDISP